MSEPHWWNQSIGERDAAAGRGKDLQFHGDAGYDKGYAKGERESRGETISKLVSGSDNSHSNYSLPIDAPDTSTEDNTVGNIVGAIVYLVIGLGLFAMASSAEGGLGTFLKIIGAIYLITMVVTILPKMTK